MALEVETGTGSSTSESYASVSFGDTYVLEYLSNDSTWSGATESAKEDALREATLYLDNRYRNSWKGRRNLKAQALAFPRIDVVDLDGFSLDSNTIPINLQRATVEAAVRSLQTSTVLEPDSSVGETGIKKKSERMDVFVESTEYVGEKSTQPFFVKIERLLKDYLKSFQGRRLVERG